MVLLKGVLENFFLDIIDAADICVYMKMAAVECVSFSFGLFKEIRLVLRPLLGLNYQNTYEVQQLCHIGLKVGISDWLAGVYSPDP